MRHNLLRSLIGLAFAAAASAALWVPLAAGAKPPAILSASVTGSTANANCATYGAVSGKVKWSGAPVDSVSVEVGSNSGGLVGTVYGSQNFTLTKAKANGFVNYSIPASGTMNILGNTDVAVVAKFFSGGVESSTVAFTDLGTCSGLSDLVITDITSNGTGGWNVTVKNQGAAAAYLDQNVTIQAYYSSSSDTTQWPPLGGNPPTAGGDPACGTSFAPTYNTTLQPNASTTIPMSCSSPLWSSDIYLVAMVDAANVVVESNESNNVFSIATT